MKRRHAEAHGYQVHPHHRRGPHRHRTGLRVRLFGHPGLQGAESRGLPHHPGQFQSGHDHDGPGAGGRHLHRADHAGGGRQDHRARAPRRPAAHHGRADRAQYRAGARQGRRARQVRGRDDRRQGRGDRHGRGPAAVPRGDDEDRPRDAQVDARPQPRGGDAGARARRPARDRAAVLHAGRHGRRRRLQPGGVRRDHRARARCLAGAPGAGRGERARLEGVRDGGGPRSRGQLHHHLLDRERRSRWACTPATRSPSRRRSR